MRSPTVVEVEHTYVPLFSPLAPHHAPQNKVKVSLNLVVFEIHDLDVLSRSEKLAQQIFLG